MKVLAFFALPVLAGPIAAATLVVDPAGGGPFAAIQPALDAAAPGDTVLVRPGEYLLVEPLDFNRLHDPGNPASPPVKDLFLAAEAAPPRRSSACPRRPPCGAAGACWSSRAARPRPAGSRDSP